MLGQKHFKINIWEEPFALRSESGFLLTEKGRLTRSCLGTYPIRGLKGLSQNELERLKKGVLTPDCRKAASTAGLRPQHYKTHPVQGLSFSPKREVYALSLSFNTPINSDWLTKLRLARHLSHLELVRTFSERFKRGRNKASLLQRLSSHAQGYRLHAPCRLGQKVLMRPQTLRLPRLLMLHI